MRVFKPSIENLDSLIAEARTENPNWQQDYLRGVAEELREDPLRYKSYGPFWWLIKRELIQAGFTNFGTGLDQEWLDNMDYGESQYNLAAAYLYSDWAAQSGHFYASEHSYTYFDEESSLKYGDDCWEDATYVLSDTDMEELIM